MTPDEGDAYVARMNRKARLGFIAGAAGAALVIGLGYLIWHLVQSGGG